MFRLLQNGVKIGILCRLPFLSLEICLCIIIDGSIQGDFVELGTDRFNGGLYNPFSSLIDFSNEFFLLRYFTFDSTDKYLFNRRLVLWIFHMLVETIQINLKYFHGACPICSSCFCNSKIMHRVHYWDVCLICRWIRETTKFKTGQNHWIEIY